jgi:type I restriction enzyme, S subunit
VRLNKTTLDKLGFVGRGRSRHRPRNDQSLFGGDYPFIQTGEVKAANLYITNFNESYNEKGLSQSKLWDEETLLITIAANIADTAILKIKACFPDSIVAFIPYENISDVKYVKYYIDYIKLELKAISQGTTQDNMSLDKLLTRAIYVHDFPTQQKIASILSAYDDLIENNNQRIQLLEEMAEEIYKEWFVRLRFPGYQDCKFFDNEGNEVPHGTLGALPEGWTDGTIGGLIEIKKGKNITQSTITVGNVPVVAGGLSPAYFHDTPNTQSPTITVSASGANSGYVNLYYENIWASDCSYIDSKMTDNLFFFYSTLKVRQKEVFYLQKGSAQPHVYPSDIMSLKLKYPKSELLDKYEVLIKPFYEEMGVLKNKNQVLQETRDLLLPRLISGKLSVEDIELENIDSISIAAEPEVEYKI